jgi:hypothetical protein
VYLEVASVLFVQGIEALIPLPFFFLKSSFVNREGKGKGSRRCEGVTGWRFIFWTLNMYLELGGQLGLHSGVEIVVTS